MGKHDVQQESEDVLDDRPIAVRRKRRISSGLADQNSLGNQSKKANEHAAGSTTPRPTRTPTKSKKRVRFSDPFPEPRTDTATASSGLTPALKRTSFVERSGLPSPLAPRLLAAKPHRRHSLPGGASNALPSPSLSPPATPYVSGEIQFFPLRQVLDERSKRRLKRNNMSEETNDIDAERRQKKSKAQMAQELQELQDELAVTRQLHTEAEGNVKAEAGTAEKVQELELELAELKEQLRARSTTAEPATAGRGAADQQSPNTSIYNDGTDDDFVMVNSDEVGVLRDSTHVHVAGGAPTDAAFQTSVSQTSISSNVENEVLRSARLSLEYLFPGEIALGLQTQDPKPILDNMLERLQTLKNRTLIAEDAAKTSSTQESNMRNQFNLMLQQLNRAQSHAEALNTQHKNEKIRAEQAEKHSQYFREGLNRAQGEIKALETDVEDKERSRQKIQDALETYRVEVGRLETLITDMEASHKAAESEMQDQMDEAVADLECEVAAETIGRRAAEKEAVERGERIKELEHLDQELRGALNDKQGVIRELENEIAKVKEQQEQEVGSLNVEIGSLASSLEEAKGDLQNLKVEKATLLFRLEEEKAAGIKAVEAMQAEMTRCAAKSDQVKVTHIKDVKSRGAEVTEHQGLLTPVSATRFKDVEGYVEVKRGKGRRPNRDSGVILEADEDMNMPSSDL